MVNRINSARWRDKAESSIALVGESTVELIVTLVIMIMVERQFGKTGLGTFSYLLYLQVFSFLDLDVWLSVMLVPLFFFVCFRGGNVFE